MTTHVGTDGHDDGWASDVDDVVDDHPELERLTQLGWIAKGLVYLLMGLTTAQIARQDAPSDDASPEGSVGRIAEAPLGRVLLVVLTVGLLMYCAWRLLTVVLIRGNSASDWGDRVGYTFSGLFYLVLAYTSGKAAFTGVDPERSNTVERLSKSVMELTAGRWLVGAGGVVVIGLGVFFVVHKGIQRSFADDLKSVSARPSDNEPKRAALVVAGVVGWIGRGVVTALVGYFVLRSAVVFEPDEARGFDRSLREIAGTGLGSALVLVCAVGLISYGVFSLVSYRFRTLKDNEGTR
jgi:amino acid transporter